MSACTVACCLGIKVIFHSAQLHHHILYDHINICRILRPRLNRAHQPRHVAGKLPALDHPRRQLAQLLLKLSNPVFDCLLPGGRLILGRVIAQLAQPLHRAVVHIPHVCQHTESPSVCAVRRRWPVQVLARHAELQEARLLLGVRGQQAKQAIVDVLQPHALCWRQGGVVQALSDAATALAVVLQLVGIARIGINEALGAAPSSCRKSIAVLQVRLVGWQRRLRLCAFAVVGRHAAAAATQKVSAGGEDYGVAF